MKQFFEQPIPYLDQLPTKITQKFEIWIKYIKRNSNKMCFLKASEIELAFYVCEPMV